MDQIIKLRQILIKKAKIIGQLKYTPLNNRNDLLNYLKTVKRQQKENEFQEKQIINSLDGVNFTTKDDFENLYFFSFAIMKSLCKNFLFVPHENEIFTDFLQMNYKFYIAQEEHEKAEKIKNIIHNGKYQNESFPRTVLQILYNWSKKKIDKTIKKTIALIEKDQLIESLQSPYKNHQSPENCENNSICEINLYGITMGMIASQKLSRKDNKIHFKTTVEKANSLFAQQSQSICVDRQLNDQKNKELSTRVSTFFESEKTQQQHPKIIPIHRRQIRCNRDYLEKSYTLIPSLNKQNFYGFYWRQMELMYKNMGLLGDLDSGFLKGVKKQKVDLKENLSKAKMEEIVQSMIKSMPKVKKTVDKYAKEYSKYCPTEIKSYYFEQKIPKLATPQKLLNSQSFMQKSQISRIDFRTKIKSQEKNMQDSSIEKLFKNSQINRFEKRSQSFQSRSLRKSIQGPIQMQIKLPVLYTPEFFDHQADYDTEKILIIQQKFQNCMVSSKKIQNKGLLRYKLGNMNREKSIFQCSKFYQELRKEKKMNLVQERKNNSFQVANILQLLRQREKERSPAKGTLTESTLKQEKQSDQKLKMKLKLTSSHGQSVGKVRESPKKSEDLFNNFDVSSPPISFKTCSKNSIFGPFNQLDFCFTSRNKRKDYLPKIA